MSGAGSNIAASDAKYAQQTTLARKYPNSADALAGFQYPDPAGGPGVNAPRNPAVVITSDYPVIGPRTPQSYGMQQYGTIVDDSVPQARNEE